MKIKVCGIFDKGNFKEILNLSPDYIGLNFYHGSKRYCRNEELADSDLGQTKLVGVFVNADMKFILQKAENYKLSLIQLHGSESVEQVVELREALPDLSIIKAIGVAEQSDLENIDDWNQCVDYLLLDRKAISFGGTGEKFNWDLLSQVKLARKFFLAGGLGLEDIRAVKTLQKVIPALFAVDINSRFEDSSGMKRVDLVKRFIEEIRE